MNIENRLPLYQWAGYIILLFFCVQGFAADLKVDSQNLTLSFRDTSVQEVYEMLSVEGNVNILLGKGVDGDVSANLYGMDLDTAIRSIADISGFIVELRDGTYFILPRDDYGKDAISTNTKIRTFKIQYSDPAIVEKLLDKHLSRYGKVTVLNDRRLLVVEDLPEFLDRIDGLLTAIDRQPKQVLIEAKILEIKLNEDERLGIDWNKITTTDEIERGTRGFSGVASTGLFLNFVTPGLEAFLSALDNKERIRTLSTPKLLVIENEEAEVIIGDRLGYKVTTTINQVTTESVEFVESGVILKVKAEVDREGMILLDIHPEVSSGTIANGIPTVTTTEVSTQFLARDGEQLFIGGLIKGNDSETRNGVPIMSDIPIIGNLFSSTTTFVQNTETVVMIKPHLVKLNNRITSRINSEKVDRVERQIGLKVDTVLSKLPSKVDPFRTDYSSKADEGVEKNDTENSTDWFFQ